MATPTITPKRNGKKAAKTITSKAVKAEVEVQRMAYEGYCIAVGFDRSLVKAQELLKQARAKDKDGLYRWHLYLISPNKGARQGYETGEVGSQTSSGSHSAFLTTQLA